MTSDEWPVASPLSIRELSLAICVTCSHIGQNFPESFVFYSVSAALKRILSYKWFSWNVEGGVPKIMVPFYVMQGGDGVIRQ